MRRLFQWLAAGVLALAVSACQTGSVPVNPGVEASLTGAGFARGTTASGNMADYICPPSRCGDLVVMVRASEQMQADPRTSLTFEDAIKSRVYNEAGVRTLFDRLFAEQGADMRLTGLKIDTSRAEMTIQFAAGSGKMRGVGRGLVQFRGNRMGGLLVISAKPSLIDRYLRRQWVP